jgi:hypothetical protein
MMKIQIWTFSKITAVTTFLLYLPLAHSQGTSADCTDTAIQDHDSTLLTREEKIVLMEQSLFASVNQHDSCMEAMQAQAANEMASGGGAGGGASGGSDGEGMDGDAFESEASDAAEPMESETETEDMTEIAGTSGAEDEIIPPKDNDQIVCSIIYEEMTNEQDSAKKAGLQKEYQKYSCG